MNQSWNKIKTKYINFAWTKYNLSSLLTADLVITLFLVLFGEESLEDAGREASLRSTDLSSPTLMLTFPLDSAYGTGRKTTSCCPVEPDANTPDEAGVAFETAKTCRTAKKREQKEDASSIRTSLQQRTKEQKQLIYGTSEDSDSEEKSTPTRTPTKKTSPKKRKTLQKKRSIKKTEIEEDNGSGCSPSSEDEETAAVAKPKHLLKPPKFDGVKPFETFWAQFKNCAEYNQWNKRQKLAYLRNSLDKDVANILWDYGKEVTESLSSLTKTLKRCFGGKAQADKYRNEIRNRRWKTEESLQSLHVDIRRLAALAFPSLYHQTRETISFDYFLDELADPDFALKVRERHPEDLDSALRIALQHEVWTKDFDRLRGEKMQEKSEVKRTREVTKTEVAPVARANEALKKEVVNQKKRIAALKAQMAKHSIQELPDEEKAAKVDKKPKPFACWESQATC